MPERKTFEIIKNAEFVIQYGFPIKNLEIVIKVSNQKEKNTIKVHKYQINFNGKIENDVTLSVASLNNFDICHWVLQCFLGGSTK